MKIVVGITKQVAGVSETINRIIEVAPFDQASIAVPKSIIEAKGDLIVGTGAGAVDNLAVGTDGKLLSADSGQSTGLNWISPGGSSTVDLVNNDAVTHDIGTVVIIDTSIDKGCKKTTALGDPKVIGVAVESVSAAATGKYMQSGQMTVLVQGNVTRGQWLIASATSGRAAAFGVTKPTSGAIGIAQTSYAGGGAGSVTALVDVELNTTAPLQKLATQTAGTTTSGIITHVVDAGTDLLIVCIAHATTQLPSAVTWNGDSLTKVAEYNGGSYGQAAMWMIENPDSGSHDIVVTSTASVWGVVARNYAGKQPSSPLRTAVTGAGALSPTSAVGDIVIDVNTDGGSLSVTGSGQVLDSNYNFYSTRYIGVSYTPGAAGTTTMSWNTMYAHVAVAIKGS
jgi:hypothetical protein